MTAPLRVVARLRPLPVDEEPALAVDGTSLQFVAAAASSASSPSLLRSPTAGTRYPFTFDAVAATHATNDDLYTLAGATELVHDVLRHGTHASIVCFGQQGAGKTHSVFGPDASNIEVSAPVPAPVPAGRYTSAAVATTPQLPLPPSAGLVPRALRQIFQSIRDEKEGTPGGLVSSVVTASFFHVYNEKVYDLFATDNDDDTDNGEAAPSSSAIYAPLQVVEMPGSSLAEGWPSSPGAAGGDGNGTGDAAKAAAAVVDMGAGVGLRALSQTAVATEEEAMALLRSGLRRRQRDPLSHSSLSHAVFRLHIEVAAVLPGPAAPIITTTAAAAAATGSATEVDVPLTRRGVLTIVDLAGSDRSTPRDAHTFAISLSLSKLRKVANELAERAVEVAAKEAAAATAEAAVAAEAAEAAAEAMDEGNDEEKKGEDDEGVSEEEDGYYQRRLDSGDDDEGDDHYGAGAGGGSDAAPAVSYKESVLTYLLKNVLSGDSASLFVAHLSPSGAHREASAATLALAQALKHLRTAPQKHIIVPPLAAAMVLKQQAAAARTLHGAAGNRQRLLDAANREKDQLVKALASEQARHASLLDQHRALLSGQQALLDEVAAARLATDTASAGPMGGADKDDAALALLQVKTALVVKQEAQIRALSQELEAARAAAVERAQAAATAAVQAFRAAQGGGSDVPETGVTAGADADVALDGGPPVSRANWRSWQLPSPRLLMAAAALLVLLIVVIVGVASLLSGGGGGESGGAGQDDNNEF